MDWTQPLKMDAKQAAEALEAIPTLRIMLNAIALFRTVGHSAEWANGYQTGMHDLIDMAVVRLKNAIPCEEK